MTNGAFTFDVPPDLVPPDLKDVWGVDVRVRTKPYTDTHTEYEWLNVLNWPKAAEIVVPDDAAVASADVAASLLDTSADVKAMTGGGVTQNTALMVDSEGNSIPSPIPNFADISSAIAVSEDVTQGGAILVGKISLPFNETSIAERTLPPFSEENYTVLKHFAGGGYVDLKKLGLVDFVLSEDVAELNASLIIVDGTPGNEKDVTYPANGNKDYGVKVVVSEGDKYLFVYDGKEDKSANDPLSLKANTQNAGGPSGSSGGCAAGFGFWGVFALAGARLFKRHGR